ncbi:zinc transport system substrate-binding protein [Halogranum amylolyticum]|uniref:Zinc transport system substrate-binding protein n=1 Tax=Halogranum amylolyticum TaxID=660520 RepID=A0A1H8PXP6_9EURY|nr:zinc transport system substrate-binding protein [Halogranum amylolyticum]
MLQPRTRRTFLASSLGAALVGSAGCLGEASPSDDGQSGGGQSDGDRTVQSSFFVASDIARKVVGEAATVESLVPFGQHGHGWEPGPDVQRKAVDADSFVYVGEGFQPWADDVVANLRTDAPDVSVIAIRSGVDLLPAPGAESDDGHGGESHQSDDGHDSHDDHEDETHQSDQTDDHDHGTADPHFWLDPTRTKAAVENVRAGFAEADPDNSDDYDANAESLLAELDALDAEFEEALASRSREVVLVAGHNAFQYLGHRYEFEVHALSGLAPDATPSPKAVREAQHVVEEHGIEHVLAPVFESDRAARQLVAETGAKEVLPVTPIPTIKPEWDDRGWGYLDVMREVNLDSLSTALGAQ